MEDHFFISTRTHSKVVGSLQVLIMYLFKNERKPLYENKLKQIISIMRHHSL